MAATRSGHGYWLVASDGGIFAFGDATFYGSTAGTCVTAIGIIPTTKGYIIAGADGSLHQMDSSVEHLPSSCPTGAAVAHSNACPAPLLTRVAQLVERGPRPPRTCSPSRCKASSRGPPRSAARRRRPTPP